MNAVRAPYRAKNPFRGTRAISPNPRESRSILDVMGKFSIFPRGGKRMRQGIIASLSATVLALAGAMSSLGQEAKPEPPVTAAPPSPVPANSTPAPGSPAPGSPAPGSPAPGSPAPGSPAPGKTQRLILVVEAPGDKSTEDVREMFQRAVRNTADTTYSSVRVQPITKLVHDSIKRFTEANAGPEVVYAGAGEVQQLTAELPDGVDKQPSASRWEVRVEPFTSVSRVKLNYGEAEAGKDPPMAVEYVAKPRSEAAAEFRFYAPGIYILSLARTDLPTSYQLETQAETAKEPNWGPKRPWPQTGRFYFVQMEDFSGDQSRLFATLKDAKIMGNAAQTVSEPKAVSITSINYTIQQIVDSGRVDALHYQIIEAKPEAIFPKRVWLFFPLTKEQQQKQLEEWNVAARTVDGRKALLDKIKAEAVKSDEKAKVPVDGAPRWYELPARSASDSAAPPILVRNGDFWRVFEVIPAFVNAAPAGPNEPIFGVKAYEFENEKKDDNFLLEVSNGRRFVGSTYPNWINAMRNPRKP